MKAVHLTDGSDVRLTGHLPEGWHETPLAAYLALAAAATMPDRCRAVAALLGLDAQPFLDNAALLVPVARAAPWLFDGSLPEAGTGAVPGFAHEGTTYTHVGDLHKINAGQMEALLGFLREHEGQPLSAAPHMLAVLYCPAGQQQTADVVAATATAFATLPMAVAWPALLAFMGNSASAGLRIRTASALLESARTMLATLEVAATAGASPTSSSKWRNWLARTWIRSARNLL